MNEDTAPKRGMGLAAKVLIVLVLATATAGAFYARHHRGAARPSGVSELPPCSLPRLVDFGGEKCVPCQLMAPMLEGLKKDFASAFAVEFVDTWKNPQLAAKYGVEIIPVQIFFAASGEELYRHEGFYAKEDILAKWREFGINTQVAPK